MPLTAPFLIAAPSSCQRTQMGWKEGAAAERLHASFCCCLGAASAAVHMLHVVHSFAAGMQSSGIASSRLVQGWYQQ